jgi:hypothetical protein
MPRVCAQATGIVVETYAENIGMVGGVDLTGYNTYRLYAKFAAPGDFLTAVYGDADFPTRIQCGNSFYHSPLGALTNQGYNPILFGGFPELEFDSFITVGMTAPANTSAGEAVINTVGDPNNNWIPAFEPGSGQTGSDILIDTQTGGSWFPLFPDANAFAGDDSLVIIGQFTTDEDLYGIVSIASFPGGNQNDPALGTFEFSTVPDAVFGCTDADATNFDANASEDNGSCVYACDYSVTQLQIETVEYTSVSCNGGVNGGVQVSVTGGQGSLTFSIDGVVANATGIFYNLEAGPATFTVEDNVGCSVELELDIPEPEPLVATAALTSPISCNGGADAIISAEAAGGTPPYQYSFTSDFSELTPDGVFEGLGEGLYTVYAMDANGCTDSSPAVSISMPTPFNLYLQEVQEGSCAAASDGVIVLNWFGGSGNDTQYSLDGLEYQTSNIFYVAPGSYTAYAVDALGCSDSLMDIFVGGSQPFSLETTMILPSCAGDEDGGLTISVAGGTGEVSILFGEEALPVENGGSVSGLAAGVYSVTVNDEAGCEETFEVVLEDRPPLVVMVTPVSALCAGGLGGLEFDIEGGVSPYDLSWANETSQVLPGATPFEGVEPGQVDWQLSDANGCLIQGMAVVGAPDAVAVELVEISPTVAGTATGSISVDISGGTPPYNTYWSSGSGVGVSSEEDPSGLPAGVYTLTVFDASGCVFEFLGWTVQDVEVPGCTDAEALNFDPSASLNDGSCTYPDCSAVAAGWSGDDTEVLPGTVEAMYGVAIERDLVLGAGTTVVEPSTGSVFALLSFTPDTLWGLPQGMMLDWPSESIGGGEFACLSLNGLPVDEGVYEVTIEGALVVSVFGNPLDAGRLAVSFQWAVISNPDPIAGCTYPSAANFLDIASEDDGSCLFPGCIDAEALNYSPHFNADSGGCLYPGDFGGTGDNIFCRADFDDSGLVGAADLLIFLGTFEYPCE